MNSDTPAVAAVLAALACHPQSSAAELAAAAGVGRSTAGKALGELAAAGRVQRYPGQRQAGRRSPDRWTLSDGGPARLGRGELAGMVLTALREQNAETSPARLARRLGRSAGAVANALVRLSADGVVELTSEAPRRYRALPG